MPRKKLARFALAGAAAIALVLIPSAGSADGGALILGASNSAASTTYLNSTAGNGGLSVSDSAAGATAIHGGTSVGTGFTAGMYGSAYSSGGVGVYGQLLNGSPVSTGGTATPSGVIGVSDSLNAFGPGVFGIHSQFSGSAAGVMGDTRSSAANAAGVYGKITSSADYSAGVRGQNDSASCCGFGVVGFHAGQGIGIGGYAPNGFGVFGWSPNNWAAWLDGAVTITKDLHVNGTLFKGAGAFRIDNPIDPAHSYLQHSFVESPDMKNIYDGVIRTNAKGYATVTLPKWFQALNKDFRYQLTSLSGLQEVAVAKEIHDDRFVIQSEKPYSRVSWQVTGVRHDPYANAHRIQVVVPKEGKAVGKYLHPQLFGQPTAKSAASGPALPKP